MMYRSFLFAWVGILILFAGCGSASQTTRSYGDDAWYVNGLGPASVHDQISEGFMSVRRIQNNTIYRSYLFPGDSVIRAADLHEMDLEAGGIQTSVDTHSNAGTATVIFNNDSRALLLTAAHAVNQPDTLLHFSEAQEGEQEDRLEAISVKISENRFVITDFGIVTLEVLGSDTVKDLALLVTTSGYESRDQLQVLNIAAADYSQVEWGSKIFAMGYPRGVQMVSAGVLSLTNHPHRTLLADLNINRGFSGGIVCTVNAGTGELEWAGMITSAMGENLTYLVPEKAQLSEYTPEMVYEGDAYIENHRVIHYGIGYGVSIDDIQNFIRENESQLMGHGILATDIF